MKRRLIAALIAVTALVSSSALAGVNPHILEVFLDIDGVADPVEFGTTAEPGGPGGFVAKDGWKKIILGYSGPAPLRTRLNWNSTKIWIYTDTNATVAISNDKVWDIENGDVMPTNLWVKGLDVSTNGPTTTTCGPEHICLEAINNGTPYITNLFDRVGFTVVAVTNIEYCRMDMNQSVATNWVTTLKVAAGAKTTDVHKAKVRVTITPTASGVSMVATNNGGGGQAVACSFVQTTFLTDIDGRIFGDYRSSDQVEDVTIKVISLADWSVSVDLGSTLSNKWDYAGDYDWLVPPYFIPEVADDVRFYPTLGVAGGAGGIDQHTMTNFAGRIDLLMLEYNFSTGDVTPTPITGSFPNYWYASPPTNMPSLTAEQVINMTPPVEESPGVYRSTHTAHDFWDYNMVTDTLTDVLVLEYVMSACDLSVSAPDPTKL